MMAFFSLVSFLIPCCACTPALLSYSIIYTVDHRIIGGLCFSRAMEMDDMSGVLNKTVRAYLEEPKQPLVSSFGWRRCVEDQAWFFGAVKQTYTL
ncbi:hypothetical protein Pyn_03409 [Prunus yedoensis var. nudiflora]|uniref:Secreted protein n=1 Tax=Prunus yedoensis var. nudiflora TaxID=2094558 RepID=A0A314YTE3_PRUYE|nr:hypothetical protein Pyn_03409 [Prunus yedoensis var. nudiflora]